MVSIFNVGGIIVEINDGYFSAVGPKKRELQIVVADNLRIEEVKQMCCSETESIRESV